ncbi:MAG: hypothetical protein KBE09_04820 [Candidatus Pacebacteria bacterium]|nr:hypothetical protein [Candidatus Paceibacterota bacterium]
MLWLVQRTHRLSFAVAAIGALAVVTFVMCMWVYTSNHIVLRLPHSFYPRIMRIASGDTVRFVNLTFQPMWPAAGPHPTHTTYPEFDARNEVAPGRSWRFTFSKEGTFAFHDHAAPALSGIVVVGPNDVSGVTDQETCTALPDPLQQAGCMEIYFRHIAHKEPFDTARTIFADIAVRYPNSCHTFAHDLGKNAYRATAADTLPSIDEEASSCGYGLWHGFTTALQAEHGIAASKDFCASLEGATEELMRANRRNCYHGIGIGLIPDPPAPEYWGKFQSLVDPALAYCDTIPGDTSYRDRCISGVFHAMNVYMEAKQYEFVFDENSLALCAQQKQEHQSTCFSTFSSAVPALAGFDLKRTVTLLRESVPPPLFPEIFKGAAVIFVDADASVETIGSFVSECGALSSDFRPWCIWATLNKLYNNGEPGSEYVKAISFCSSAGVRAHEKNACFKEVVSNAHDLYDTEKMRLVCASVSRAHGSMIPDCSVLER